MYFGEGDIIKGKDIDFPICKLVYNFDYYGNFVESNSKTDFVGQVDGNFFHYNIGMNDNDSADEKGENGLFYSPLSKILSFVPDYDYGNIIAFCSVPEDEKVYVGEDEFWSRRLIVNRFSPLSDKDTMLFVCENTSEDDLEEWGEDILRFLVDEEANETLDAVISTYSVLEFNITSNLLDYAYGTKKESSFNVLMSHTDGDTIEGWQKMQKNHVF